MVCVNYYATTKLKWADAANLAWLACKIAAQERSFYLPARPFGHLPHLRIHGCEYIRIRIDVKNKIRQRIFVMHRSMRSYAWGRIAT